MRTFAAIALILIGSALVGLGHDMWLEAESYIVPANQETLIRNGNGTVYVRSENAVAPDRIARLLALGPIGEAAQVGEPFEDGDWTAFRLQVSDSGNYWVGLATRPRTLKMSADDFNQYLEHDGLPHVLAERRSKGIAGRAEAERYSKYVKAYLQAGHHTSSNYDSPLGLQIEIVPLRNPYGLAAGQQLPVRVLFRGRPLEAFLIHSGRAGHKEQGEGIYTDSQGEASIPIDGAGRWYLRGIHLFEVEGQQHSYESYWATLTFEVPSVEQ